MEITIPTQPLCPECGNNDIISDDRRGEITCRQCGIVINESVIDHTPEYRVFEHEDKGRIRVGDPDSLLRHIKNLSTTILHYKDGRGNLLTSKTKAIFYRMNKWQHRTLLNTSVDRNIDYAMNLIDKIGGQLNLSKQIKESAAYIYHKILKKCIMRGRSIVHMVTACLYIECRLRKLPHTLNDFLYVTHLERGKVVSCYQFIVKVLNITFCTNTPNMYVSRYCSDLNLTNNTLKRSTEILQSINSHSIAIGKNPIGLAGAVIYISSKENNEPRTQRELSVVTGLTEATIRNRYKEIEQYIMENQI